MKIQKMNKLNKSVIILDSPSKSKFKSTKRKCKVVTRNRNVQSKPTTKKLEMIALQKCNNRNKKLVKIIKDSKKKVKLKKKKQCNQKKLNIVDEVSSDLSISVITLSDNENEDSVMHEEKKDINEKRQNSENVCIYPSPTQILQSLNRLRKREIKVIDNAIQKQHKRKLENDENKINKKTKITSNSVDDSVDDIIEVWSSMENCQMMDTHSKSNISKKNNIPVEKDSSHEAQKQSTLNQKQVQQNNENPLEDFTADIWLSNFQDENQILSTYDTVMNKKNKYYPHQHRLFANAMLPSRRWLPGSLREIIIDGCNVAMAYTHGKTFSEDGLKLVVDYFLRRGHTVRVFIPQHKRSISHPLLEKLYREGIVVFTPSRSIGKKRITSYDDRFILQYATMCRGIVISHDQFRDLYEERAEWRDTIENRLLAPTFVGDYVMFPEDPLGRNGPSLDEFLRHR